MIKAIAHKLGRAYIGKLTGEEYNGQRFNRHNERPIEFAFVFEQIRKFRPVSVLDVGTGETSLPHMMRTCGCVVTAIDNVTDYWPKGMVNRHYKVIDDNILKPAMTQRFDLVTCVSVIEHIDDHVTAFKNMASLVKPGGHLIITCPYNEQRYVPNVYKLDGAAYGQTEPYPCRSTSRNELNAWIATGGVALEQQDFWQLWTGDVWTQGQFTDAKQVNAAEKHQLSTMLFKRI